MCLCVIWWKKFSEHFRLIVIYTYPNILLSIVYSYYNDIYVNSVWLLWDINATRLVTLIPSESRSDTFIMIACKHWVYHIEFVISNTYFSADKWWCICKSNSKPKKVFQILTSSWRMHRVVPIPLLLLGRIMVYNRIFYACNMIFINELVLFCYRNKRLAKLDHSCGCSGCNHIYGVTNH